MKWAEWSDKKYTKSLTVVVFGGIFFFLLLFCILQIF